MKLETFFEKFDQFADAPGAVARLRDVVYSVGLESKKWPHESLESVTLKVTDGTHKTPRYVEKGIPFVSVKDFSGGSLDMSATRSITPEEHSEIYKRCDPKRGDILMGRIGTIGKAVIVDTDIEFSLFVSAAQIRPDHRMILSRYLQHVLNSPFCRIQFDQIKVGGATHTNKLNLKDLRLIKIPLPPLAEQKRIMAKVDELMALCDRLEAQQQAREEQSSQLARASLARFATAPTPANLNYLFHPSYNVSPSDLRKSILTLAVQGKLVPQNPNDEPVQESLARNDERRRETALSDHRADADNQPMLSADDRWHIADSWSWRVLTDLVLFVDYRGKTPSKLSSGIRLLTAKNVRKGQINLNPEEFLSEDEYHAWMTRGIPSAGDVLFTTEAPMGNAAVVDLTERFALAQRVICFQSYGALNPAFLVLQILSDQFQFILDKNGTGVTAKGIKASKLKLLPIAVPPLNEQHRIVAKVQQLMTLVDELEAHLTTTRTTAQNLLSALVAELPESKISCGAMKG